MRPSRDERPHKVDTKEARTRRTLLALATDVNSSKASVPNVSLDEKAMTRLTFQCADFMILANVVPWATHNAKSKRLEGDGRWAPYPRWQEALPGRRRTG